MTTTNNTELVSEKVRERFAQSGLLGAGETVIACTTGQRPIARRIQLFSYVLVPIGPLLALPLVLRYTATLVLTDRHLYILSASGKRVVSTHSCGAYAAALSTRRSRLLLTVADEEFLLYDKARIRARAEAIVAAGKNAS
jgi:hypothetical protein